MTFVPVAPVWTKRPHDPRLEREVPRGDDMVQVAGDFVGSLADVAGTLTVS